MTWASRPGQLDKRMRSIEDGYLDAELARKIDSVWNVAKEEAPTDNHHS